MSVFMPVNSSGTRWLTESLGNELAKQELGSSYCTSYDLIEDESFTSAGRETFKGMYNKYRNAKYHLFVLH